MMRTMSFARNLHSRRTRPGGAKDRAARRQACRTTMSVARSSCRTRWASGPPDRAVFTVEGGQVAQGRVHAREQEGAIPRIHGRRLVDRAEIKPEATSRAGGIVKDVPAQFACHVDLGVRFLAPADRGTVEESTVAGRQVLAMTVVSPVGDQESRGPVPVSGRGRAAEVGHAVR